jgi:DNA-binding beta-propeller fold protein YncE
MGEDYRRLQLPALNPRRLIGLGCLLILVGVAVGILGIELPSSSSAPPLPGVRARVAAAVVRSGLSAPPGELAFMAVEPSGNLVVSDRYRRSLLRFDAAGTLLSEWGPRLGEITLGEPAGVAVQEDHFLVLDRGTPRLLSLDISGRLESAVDLQPFQPYGLNGLAIDPQGFIYIADTGRNRLLVLTQTGAFVRQVGRGGSSQGEFTQPMAVAFASDGGFYVADWENGRIDRWASMYVASDSFSTSFRPYGVAVDRLGRVYVPDALRGRVVVYSPQGAMLGELGGGERPIDVDEPRQVAIPPSGAPSVYVLGPDGVVRIDVENVAPPALGQDLDVPSLAAIAVLSGLVVVAVLIRRRRASVQVAPLHRPIGLRAEDGT